MERVREKRKERERRRTRKRSKKERGRKKDKRQTRCRENREAFVGFYCAFFSLVYLKARWKFV